MSTLADTPDLSRAWCPTCEPDHDPTREILRVDYCGDHLPDRQGSADAAAVNRLPPGEMTMRLQEGGMDGRAWNDLLLRSPR